VSARKAESVEKRQETSQKAGEKREQEGSEGAVVVNLQKMNKQQVLELGKRMGYQAGAAEAVDKGFQTGLYLALAGYYNTKPDELISDKEFGIWSRNAEAECSRIFGEIRGDYDVTKYAIVSNPNKETLEDNVHYSMIKLDDLRKYLEMDRL